MFLKFLLLLTFCFCSLLLVLLLHLHEVLRLPPGVEDEGNGGDSEGDQVQDEGGDDAGQGRDGLEDAVVVDIGLLGDKGDPEE